MDKGNKRKRKWLPDMRRRFTVNGITGGMPSMPYSVDIDGTEIYLDTREIARWIKNPDTEGVMMDFPEVYSFLIDVRAHYMHLLAIKEEERAKETGADYMALKLTDMAKWGAHLKEGAPSDTFVSHAMNSNEKRHTSKNEILEIRDKLERLGGTLSLLDKVFEGTRSINANHRALGG